MPTEKLTTVAAYDSTLKVPKCATAAESCSSGILLDGRGSIGPSEQGTSPNTLGTCTDGNSGTYHSDESIDAIKVSSIDGGLLTAGKTAEIEATVYVYDPAADFADFYFATNPSNPTWTLIGTANSSGNGLQAIKMRYTVPSGQLQAVRVVFRWNGNASTSNPFQCPSSGYDDIDDVVFAVSSNADMSATPSPTFSPTKLPTNMPTPQPSPNPTNNPTSEKPTSNPTNIPTQTPTNKPTLNPTKVPTQIPTNKPTSNPTNIPTQVPTRNPTVQPTEFPTKQPVTLGPSNKPTYTPTRKPTAEPSAVPTKHPVTTAPSNKLTNSPTIADLTCYENARKVRLESSTGEQIQMFELKALSSGTNVALQKTATQSSNWNNIFLASKAIDGDKYTFSHTRDSNAYWEVDFGGAYSIDNVVILNRWCKDALDSPGCLCRLSSATLVLLNETNSVVASRTLGNTCATHTIIESFVSDPGCPSQALR